MAIIIRGTAQAVAFRVCANRGDGNEAFTFFPFGGGGDAGEAGAAAGRYRMFSLRLW